MGPYNKLSSAICAAFGCFSFSPSRTSSVRLSKPVELSLSKSLIAADNFNGILVSQKLWICPQLPWPSFVWLVEKTKEFSVGHKNTFCAQSERSWFEWVVERVWRSKSSISGDYLWVSRLSPPQRLPLSIPIKIAIIEKVERARGASSLSFSFSRASPQFKAASAEERGLQGWVAFGLLRYIYFESKSGYFFRVCTWKKIFLPSSQQQDTENLARFAHAKSAFRKFAQAARAVHEKENIMQKSGLHDLWRQRGRVVSASDSQSGGPGFESRSGHLLDLCSVVPSSNSRPRL